LLRTQAGRKTRNNSFRSRCRSQTEQAIDFHLFSYNSLVAGPLSLCFLTPDFIMYKPISMKTTAPAKGGTQVPQEKNAELGDRNAKERYQIIEKRMTDARPRINRPIQKTEVFSPLNIFRQISLCRPKLLRVATMFRFSLSST
jgi:hypothetical protein